jgi:hypothetical protein
VEARTLPISDMEMIKILVRVGLEEQSPVSTLVLFLLELRRQMEELTYHNVISAVSDVCLFERKMHVNSFSSILMELQQGIRKECDAENEASNSESPRGSDEKDEQRKAAIPLLAKKGVQRISTHGFYGAAKGKDSLESPIITRVKRTPVGSY